MVKNLTTGIKVSRKWITVNPRLSPTLLYQTFKQAPPSNKRPIYLDEIGRLFEASKAKTKNHYIGIYFTVKYRDTLPHCKQNR